MTRVKKQKIADQLSRRSEDVLDVVKVKEGEGFNYD